MSNLFDKETGTTTSFDSSKVTDSSKSWTVNQFKNWYIEINGTEYQIDSNTETELLFTNAIAANYSYTIAFVGRSKLTELESDCSNTTKIPSDLISKKYNQSNQDIHSKVFANLRSFLTSEFDPLNNIKNLYCLQQVFSYYLLSKIFQDLSISEDSFESFKGYNMYEKSYNDGIRDALSMLQIDFDESGTIEYDEKNRAPASVSFFSR